MQNQEDSVGPVALEDARPANVRQINPSASSPTTPSPQPPNVVLLLSRLRAAVLDVEMLSRPTSLGKEVSRLSGTPTPYLAGDDTVRFLQAADNETANGVDGQQRARQLVAARNIILELMSSKLLTELTSTIKGEEGGGGVSGGLGTISEQVDAVFTWLLCTQLLMSPTTQALMDKEPDADSHEVPTAAPSTQARFSSTHRRGAAAATRTSSHRQIHRSFCASADLHLLDVLEAAARLLKTLIAEEEAASGALDEALRRCEETTAQEELLQQSMRDSHVRQRLIWVLFCSFRIALGCRESRHWELAPPEQTPAPQDYADSCSFSAASSTCMSTCLGGCSCFGSRHTAQLQTSRTSAVLGAVMDTGLLLSLVPRWIRASQPSERANEEVHEDAEQTTAELDVFHRWIGTLTLGLLEQLLCRLGADASHHADEIGLLFDTLYSVDDFFGVPGATKAQAQAGPAIPLMQRLAGLLSYTSGRHNHESAVSGQIAARVLSLCVALFGSDLITASKDVALLLLKGILREALLRLADAAATIKAEQDSMMELDARERGRGRTFQSSHEPTGGNRWCIHRERSNPSGRAGLRRERHGVAAASPPRPAVVVGSSDAAPAWSSDIHATTRVAPPTEAALLVAVLRVAPELWTVDIAKTFSCKNILANPIFPEWMAAAALTMFAFTGEDDNGAHGFVLETLSFSVSVVSRVPITSVPVSSSVGIFDPSSSSNAASVASPAFSADSPLVAMSHPTHPSRLCAQSSAVIRLASPYSAGGSVSSAPGRVAIVCETVSHSPALSSAGVLGSPPPPPTAVLTRISGQPLTATEGREGRSHTWSSGLSSLLTGDVLHGTETVDHHGAAAACVLSLNLVPDGPLIPLRLQRRAVEFYLFSPDTVAVHHHEATLALPPSRMCDPATLSARIAVCSIHVSEVSVWMPPDNAAVPRHHLPRAASQRRLLWRDDGGHAPLGEHLALRSLLASPVVLSSPSRSHSPRGSSNEPNNPSSRTPPAYTEKTSHEANLPGVTQQEEQQEHPAPPSPQEASTEAQQAAAEELQASRLEVAELRALLSQKAQSLEKLQQRLEESEEQRQSATQRLADLRLELELCQTAMVGPLRQETTNLRRQLAAKEEDLHLAMDAVHTLALDNEVLSGHLHEALLKLERHLQ